MLRLIVCAVTALMLSVTANAAPIVFDTDPFAGSTALTTPGRQIVGGEDAVAFDIAHDVFTFDASAFGVIGIQFANDVVGNLPSSGVNTVVLRSFDNDANPATAFGAGNAADLIAARFNTSAPGFFLYFNSGLKLARLVFSRNLSDSTADLKILARLTNLSGQAGRDAFPSFSAANFALTNVTVPSPIPEPSTFSLLLTAAALLALRGVFAVGKKGIELSDASRP